MSDSERLFNPEWQADNIEKGTETMKRITAELGYTDSTLADLALTPAEIEQLYFIQKLSADNIHGYSADRQDGTKARVLINPTGQGDFKAEIFSPAYFEGHHCNHDSNESELRNMLTTAINNPVYPRSQR